jgi:hypothetical protein
MRNGAFVLRPDAGCVGCFLEEIRRLKAKLDLTSSLSLRTTWGARMVGQSRRGRKRSHRFVHVPVQVPALKDFVLLGWTSSDTVVIILVTNEAISYCGSRFKRAGDSLTQPLSSHLARPAPRLSSNLTTASIRHSLNRFSYFSRLHQDIRVLSVQLQIYFH